MANQAVTDQNKIQNVLQRFYKNLFKSNRAKSYDDCKEFLNKSKTRVLTSKTGDTSEIDLVDSELFKLLNFTQDCKSLCNVIKEPLLNSIVEARKNKKLNVSQRQTVIKLIEKWTQINVS